MVHRSACSGTRHAATDDGDSFHEAIAPSFWRASNPGAPAFRIGTYAKITELVRFDMKANILCHTVDKDPRHI
jgi:hypothetical protein